MNRLVLNNVARRKAQVAGMMVTIVVSAMVLTCLLLLYGGVQRGVALNEARGGADIMVVPGDVSSLMVKKDVLFTGAPVMAYMPQSLEERISAVPGVRAVSSQFYGQTLQAACCSTGTEARIIGIDMASDWVVMPFCRERVTALADDEVIVGALVEEFPRGTGTLLGRDVRVAATLEPTGSSLDYSIFMDIAVVRAMVAENKSFDHFWRTYGKPDEIVSAIMVDVEDSVDPVEVTRVLYKLGDVDVLRRSEVLDETTTVLNELFSIMLVAGVVLACASMLQLVARFGSSVWERKAELALYRALGASTKALRALIWQEALVITAAGLALGVALGVALYFVGLGVLQGAGAFPFSALPLSTSVAGIAGVVVLFLVAAAASVAYPLSQVAKVDPASAMQQVDIG